MSKKRATKKRAKASVAKKVDIYTQEGVIADIMDPHDFEMCRQNLMNLFKGTLKTALWRLSMFSDNGMLTVVAWINTHLEGSRNWNAVSWKMAWQTVWSQAMVFQVPQY